VGGDGFVSSDVLFGALFSNPWIGAREGLVSKMKRASCWDFLMRIPVPTRFGGVHQGI